MQRLEILLTSKMQRVSRSWPVPRRATYKPVHINSDMEDLVDRAINQNYVPVVDDQGSLYRNRHPKRHH